MRLFTNGLLMLVGGVAAVIVSGCGESSTARPDQIPAAAGKPAVSLVSKAPDSPDEPAASVPGPEPGAATEPPFKIPEAVIAGANLLKNGSFDQPAPASGGIPHWRMPAGVTAELAKASYDGPRSLCVALAGSRNFGAPQAVTVTPGAQYMVRGYLKAKDLEGGARLEVQDAAGGYQSFLAYTPAVTGTRDWTLVEKAITIPENVTSLMVYLRRPAHPEARDSIGSVWFDRCEVLRLAPAESPNLVNNGSFEWGENGLLMWSELPNGVTATQRDGGVDGAKFLELLLPGAMDLGISQQIAVTPGRTYSLTGYIRSGDPTGKARLEVVDRDGGWQSFISCSESITGTQEWTPLSLVFETPAHVNWINVLLRRLPADDAGESTVKLGFDGYALYRLVQ